MRFNVLYADPPWEYKNKNTGGSIKIKKKNKSGASQKYKVLSFNDLLSLPISNIIDDKGTVLFLWATISMMMEAMSLLKEWGFAYKTMMIWNKNKGYLGMGSWFRVNTEFLIIAIKGKNIKAFHSQRSNLVNHPVLKHSEKPEIFREIINDVVSKSLDSPIRKLELFARKNHHSFIKDKSDWMFIGNEIDGGKDIRERILELSAVTK